MQKKHLTADEKRLSKKESFADEQVKDASFAERTGKWFKTSLGSTPHDCKSNTHFLIY